MSFKLVFKIEIFFTHPSPSSPPQLCPTFIILLAASLCLTPAGHRPTLIAQDESQHFYEKTENKWSQDTVTNLVVSWASNDNRVFFYYYYNYLDFNCIIIIFMYDNNNDISSQFRLYLSLCRLQSTSIRSKLETLYWTWTLAFIVNGTRTLPDDFPLNNKE